MTKKTKPVLPPIPPVPSMPPFGNVPPMDGIPHPAPHRHGKPHNHSARFMPMILHPRIPHHFNFWCNKIIPLAYDDSMSYYELLAKTTDYLNNMLNDEKMLAINIEEIAQAFCELQNFVNDYFAFYQSKGIINYEIAVTNANYKDILPDCDEAQMNTLYRLKFAENSSQEIPLNLPGSAKPFSGAECVLFNLSNFELKRVGNEWVEITDDEKEYSTENNYQLLITDKDIFFRENNGDSWLDWQSIFGNWWNAEFENVKTWVQEYVTPLIEDINTRLAAEIARAEAAEAALGDRITAETTRAEAAESALGDRITAETARAEAAEQSLDDKIEQEIDDRETADTALSNAISAEVTRATNAENGLSSAITAETSRATAAENALSSAITAETSRATTAENTLNAAVAAEVTRATGAEAALGDRITAEVSRATAAEQGIRDGYIPNGGNTLSNVDLTLVRSVIALSTVDGDIELSTANNTNGEIDLYADGDIQLSGNNVTIQTNNEVDLIVGGSANVRADEIEMNSDSNVIINSTGDMTLNCDSSIELNSVNGIVYLIGTDVEITPKTTGKAYYYKQGSTLDTTADEIATIGDLGDLESDIADLYIPKVGDTTTGSLNLQRIMMNLTAVGGSSRGAVSISPGNINFNAVTNSGTGTFNIGSAVTLATANSYITMNDSSIGGVTINTSIGDGNHRAYYVRNSGERASADTEIARIKDVNAVSASVASGYVPNEGNEIANGGFSLTRHDMSFHYNGRYELMNDNYDATTILSDTDGVVLYGINHNVELSVGYESSGSVEVYIVDEFIICDKSGNPTRELIAIANHADGQYTTYRLFDHVANAELYSRTNTSTTLDLIKTEVESFTQREWFYGTIYYNNRIITVDNASDYFIDCNDSGGHCKLVFNNCTFNWGNGNVQFYACDVEFNNCAFVGDNATRLVHVLGHWKYNNCTFNGCGCNIGRVDGDVIFDNCVFDGVASRIYCTTQHTVATQTALTSIGKNIVTIKNCFNVDVAISYASGLTGYADDVLICNNNYIALSNVGTTPAPIAAVKYYNNANSSTI